MERRVTILPESVPECDRTFTSDGELLVPAGGDFTEIDSADGIVHRLDSGFRSPVPMTPVSPHEGMDVVSALQIGLANLLYSADFYYFDLQDLMESRRPRFHPFRIDDVFFDWPRHEDDRVEDAREKPKMNALILLDEDSPYDADVNPEVLEDTRDVYGHGTVLRRLASFQCTLAVVMYSVHKDERRGVRKWIEENLLAEPSEDIPGRRVVISEYYNRVARYRLRSLGYRDEHDSARSNQWSTVCRIEAEIDKVVRVPYVEMKHPGFGLDVRANVTDDR